MFPYTSASVVETVLAIILFCLISYLLGSISFAVIFTKKFANTDVRNHGSGNAGMTNVIRTAGKLPGILTFIFDFLKGVVAVLIPKIFMNVISNNIFEGVSKPGMPEEMLVNPVVVECLVGIFCLLGHMFPCFFRFKGGKGVATIAGILIVISPFSMLIALAIFLGLTLITKIVSSSSIVGVTVATICTYIFYTDTTSYILFSNQRLAVTILVGIMALMVIVKHHENIKRLINGTENKFGSKNK